jgi:hypothetical protein
VYYDIESGLSLLVRDCGANERGLAGGGVGERG